VGSVALGLFAAQLDFRSVFCCERAAFVGGLGSLGVGGPPRIGFRCFATPRPASGAGGASWGSRRPSPGWWFSQARNERTLSELNVRCARLLE
jgi:hypothetical protein